MLTFILHETVYKHGLRAITDMDAVILAGGFGTRLKPVISDLPKPMAPIRGKPFLGYLLHHISRYAISRFILCTGYYHQVIEDYFGADFNGIPIVYSIETEPLGTGGAVRQALHLISHPTFYLFNGDSFFAIDLNTLAQQHFSLNADLSIALKRMVHFDRYGTVCLAGQRIIKFEEKKRCAEGRINGGVYCVNKSIFSTCKLQSKFSFEKDLLETAVNDFYFAGIDFDSYFIDIGIPEDYEKAQKEMPLASKKIDRRGK